MTEKQLLELAAKAADLELANTKDGYPFWAGGVGIWNPLTDDGDAFRLAIKLGLDINNSWTIVNGDDNYPMATINVSFNEEIFFYELKESDPFAATRKAIVHIAAEIGRRKA